MGALYGAVLHLLTGSFSMSGVRPATGGFREDLEDRGREANELRQLVESPTARAADTSPTIAAMKRRSAVTSVASMRSARLK